MAFQDFDLISQRREQQRKQKLKRRLMIAVGSIVVLLLIVGAAFGVMTYKNNQGTDSPAADSGDKPSKASPSKSVNTVEKAVDTVCATTDYEKTCQSSLSKSVKSDSDNLPEDILKSAFSVVSAAIDKVAEQAKSLKPNDPLKKAALEDCLELMADAKEELNASISAVKEKGMTKVSTVKPELENWLSAVVSYQQTCIDGFPDGEEKKTMEKNLKTAKELGSNALAIVSEALTLLTKLKAPATAQRKLLGVDDTGLPVWMNQESRRMLKNDPPKFTPNVTVAKDGSGKFKTINEALKAMPKSYTGRYVIYVKEGVYDETVTITRTMAKVTMFGEGSQKSIITGSKSFADGVTTLQTAAFVVLGEDFQAQSIGFRNTAGPGKKQAVALRVQGDHAIFINCRMEGYQAPLYAQAHRQFYRACYITGTVDIILGDATAVFQNCNIYIRKGVESEANTVTAQGRVDKRETTGFVLHNSRILPDKDLESVKSKLKSYLGRPLQAYAKTIVMESEISDVIQAEGWVKGAGGDYSKSLFFGEYKNEGGGADTSGRVKWGGYKGSMGKDEAMEYTVGPFLQGESWIKDADVPVKFGMFH